MENNEHLPFTIGILYVQNRIGSAFGNSFFLLLQTWFAQAILNKTSSSGLILWHESKHLIRSGKVKKVVLTTWINDSSVFSSFSLSTEPEIHFSTLSTLLWWREMFCHDLSAFANFLAKNLLPQLLLGGVFPLIFFFLRDKNFGLFSLFSFCSLSLWRPL